MADNFEIRKRLWSLLTERESHKSKNERHECPKMPRELMKRLTTVTDLYPLLKSETNREYSKLFLSALVLRFVLFLSALVLRFVSNNNCEFRHLSKL